MSITENNEYFSISDILMTEERIQCQTLLVLPKLGFLSASSKTDDLEAHTKLDLPLWLADSLNKPTNNHQQRLISCEIPKYFKENYREILNADACAVELNKFNSYYYQLGFKIPQSNLSELLKLTEFLLKVFQERFRLIINWEQDSFSTHRTHLTNLERKLLLQASHEKKQLLNWLNQGVKQIKTSNVLDNIRKRKRLDI